MAPPFNSGAADPPPRENPPSNNLWVGNVSTDVSEAELRALFENYGRVDTVTSYPPRNYAFVHFKDIEAAKSAKQGLQSHFLCGNSLKIEFAKPAKPCKSLWVAGISQSVSREDLEEEFLKFGKIQEFKFLRDRNTAYVDYVRLEDATQALKSMNLKRIGGSQIRVDYLRSQPSKREHEGQFPGRNMGPSDFRRMGQDSLNQYPDPSRSGSKRQNQFLSNGSDSLPSKVLWIRHPPPVIIEEDMLHNAMILFGEIERIKTFGDRNYTLVEFRSVEEASRAKEGLQGKLFNDPRISIEYYGNEFSGVRGQASEFPFQPIQMDILGVNRPVLLNNNPEHLPSRGIRGADLYSRPLLSTQRTFEPAHYGPDLIDLAAVPKLQKPIPQPLVGGPSWRRSSPGPGIVSSPPAGLPNRSVAGAWDVFYANQLQRESKRSRIDTALPIERAGPLGRLDGSDCIWRGLITKGGTPVCRARCVPIGGGLDTDIPDVVDCCARTGLERLSEHYDDAIGFDIVFFLPDSEEDFAPYTEFLKFLGSRNRAGVAKFADGTNLFLVPPSEFLTKVLKVSGLERLYGLVLKFSQVAPPTSTSTNLLPVQPPYADPHRMTTLQTGYNATPQQERFIPLDNSRVLSDASKLPANSPVHVASSFPAHSAPVAVVASQASLTLTPELIATLTSLLPAVNSSSCSQTVSSSQIHSTFGSASNVAADPDNNVAHWKHEQPVLDHNGQLLQELSSQINPQLQHLPAAQSASIVSNSTGHFHQTISSYSQMHDRTINVPFGADSSKAMAPGIPLQGGPVTVAPEINQYYQPGSSQDLLRGHGADNGTDARRFYNTSMVQQQAYPVASSSQVHVGDVSMSQPYMPLPLEMNQSQLQQTAPYGAVQDRAEAEADKNERYKSTLLAAADILARISKPLGNQLGQGPGSH